MKTDNASLLDLIAGRAQVKRAHAGRAVGGSLSSLLLSGMHKRSGVSFGGTTVLGGGSRPTVLGGSRPTVLGGGPKPTVLSGGPKPTVLSGGPKPTVLGGGPKPTVLGASGGAGSSVPRIRMPKLAQYLGSANLDRRHSASRSMAEGDALRRRAAAEAVAARSRQANLERLPPAQQKAEVQRRFEQSLPNVVKRMGWDEVEKAVDAEGGVTPWGQTTPGRVAGAAVMAIPATASALSGTADLAYHAAGDYLGRFGRWARARWNGQPYKPKPSMGWGQLLADRWRNSYDTLLDDGGDVANNWQLQANAGAHAGNGLWRTFVRYSPNVNLARLVMPKSLSDKISDLSQDNDWANASDKHYARQLRIMRSMNNPDLRPPEDVSNLSPLNPAVGNYLLNGAAGEYAAGEALTLGAGAVAKGLGKGVEAGTRTLGNWIRGADATADVAAAAARAAAPAAQATTWAGRLRRVWDATKEGAKYVKDHPVRAARHRLASGVEHVGNATAVPFRWVGNVAMPVAGGKVQAPVVNAVKGTGRAGLQVAKDIGNTGKALFYDPVHLLRNPAGRRLFRAHPRRMAGKWMYNTARPFGKYPANATKWFFSNNGWRDMAGAGAAAGVLSGDLGSARDSLADYGKLGLLGPLWTPYYLMHDVPQIVMGEDERK